MGYFPAPGGPVAEPAFTMLPSLRDAPDWYIAPGTLLYEKTGMRPLDIPGVRTRPNGASLTKPWPYEVPRNLLPLLGINVPLVGARQYPPILRPYQRVSYDFIRSRRGTLLSDEQRVGKTVPTIYALDEDDTDSMFVIGPLASRGVWHEWAARRFGACVEQLQHFAGEKKRECPICTRVASGGTDIVINGGAPSFMVLEGRTLDAESVVKWKPRVLFCTFAVTSTHRRLFANLRRISQLVIDEAHLAGVQNRKSITVESIRWLNSVADRVIAITGTPLYNKVKGLWPLLDIAAPASFGGFWDFARRFCTISSTPILMGDYRQKQIGEVQVGDEVVGWIKRSESVRPSQRKTKKPTAGAALRETLCKARVTRVQRRLARVVRVRFASGDEVICTPDHQWLNARSHNAEYQYTNALPLSQTGLGRPAKEGAKDLVRVLPPTLHSNDFSEEYARGYMQGALDGDGAVRCRYYANGTVATSDCVLRVISRDFALRFKLHVEQCGFPTTFIEQPAAYTTKRGQLRSRFTVRVRGGFTTFVAYKNWSPKTYDEWAGWLGGMYDAEGHAEKICQYRAVNPEKYARIVEALRFFSFRFSEHPEHVSIIGIGGRSGGGPAVRREAMLRFWVIARPSLSYKLDKVVLQGKFRTRDRVVAVEALPIEMEVVSLTTTTGNYIAGGHASKNCGARPGAHGWSADGETHADELRARLGEIMLRRTWRDVQPDLPLMTRTLEMVPLPQSVKDSVEEAAAQVRFETRSAKTFVGDLARLRKLYAREKTEHALKLIHEQLDAGRSVVAWAWHTDVADTLFEKLSGAGVPTYGPIYGATSAGKRERALAEAETDTRPRVIVANILSLSTAVSLAWAPVEVFVELDWVPVNIAQAEMRIVDGKTPRQAIYCVADVDADERLAHALIHKLETADKLGLKAGMGDVADILADSLGVERGRTLDDLAQAILTTAQDYV